jgi:INO80 complex subunit C
MMNEGENNEILPHSEHQDLEDKDVEEYLLDAIEALVPDFQTPDFVAPESPTPVYDCVDPYSPENDFLDLHTPEPEHDTFEPHTPERKTAEIRTPEPQTPEDPTTPEIMPANTSSEEHQALLDSLDLNLKPKPWKNPNWKPSSRRNKSVKQIISEQQRREASVMATQNNSGTTTPAQQSTRAGTPSGDSNGVAGPSNTGANITQASRNLQTMVLERNMQASLAANETPAGGDAAQAAGDTAPAGGDTGPVATYTNIEAAPSVHPGKKKKYCDITGLPAAYTDPKTRLNYANKEVFKVIRNLPPGVAEQYLAARNANTILK